MLATKVPCPRPSPGELWEQEQRFTWARIRPEKSLRPASIPESMIAIVGTFMLEFVKWGQSLDTSEAAGQS